MVDPIGTPLAIIGTVDLCVKYGKTFIKKCKSFRDAPSEIAELILCVENYWLKFEYQSQFLRQIWDSLDDRLQLHRHSLIHQLQLKLQKVNDLLDGAIGVPTHHTTIQWLIGKDGDVRRARYAFSLHDCLNQAVEDLKKWHEMFDPSWYLLIRSSSPKVDHELISHPARNDNSSVLALQRFRQAIQAEQSGVDHRSQTSIWTKPDTMLEQRGRVPNSSVQITRDRDTAQSFLIDTVVPHPQTQSSQADIRDLARILSRIDTNIFGLLSCAGVIKDKLIPDKSLPMKFELVLPIPQGLRSPKSLRTLLLIAKVSFSLNERLSLALTLASSVMFIHSSKMVHKNIRPDTTIVFEDDTSQMAAPFLVGFEKFRPLDARSMRIGDLYWYRDLYRHPSRQGLQPEEDYIMQHDIYSLGVLLLEIGLWTSFVEHKNDGSFVSGSVLGVTSHLVDHNSRRRAVTIKQRLIDLASTRLQSEMGRKYSSIILACLTCLDKTDNGFGDQNEFLDEDGIVVGVRFSERVIMRLHEISV